MERRHDAVSRTVGSGGVKCMPPNCKARFHTHTCFYSVTLAHLFKKQDCVKLRFNRNFRHMKIN